MTTFIKNLTVSSNDESVCKVNLGECFKDIEDPAHAYFDVELIGIKPEETDIIVSAGSGVSAKCHVTVTPENFFGTSLESFRDEDLSADISIEWDINSLINIGDRDTSLALEGLLLSQDTYSGEDAVAQRMMSFGLLLNKGGLTKYEDPNTKTGWCCFVGVRKVSVGDDYYNIITASARGTVKDNYMSEWLGNILYTEGFF